MTIEHITSKTAHFKLFFILGEKDDGTGGGNFDYFLLVIFEQSRGEQKQFAGKKGSKIACRRYAKFAGYRTRISQ